MRRPALRGPGALLVAAAAAAGCAASLPLPPARQAAASAPAAPVVAAPAATPAAGPGACRPAPFGGRTLYARGDFNSWGLDDGARLVYACDHYERVGSITGRHAFKIADEDWSPDASFGAPAGLDALQASRPQALARQGGDLHYDFRGPTRLVMRVDDPSRPPVLTVSDCPAAPGHPLSLFLRAATAAAPAADAQPFLWQCDAYYLNVGARAPHDFLLAVRDGRAADTFGAADDPALLPDGSPHVLAAGDPHPRPLHLDAPGEHTLRLAFDGPGGAPTLTAGPKTFADPRPAPVTDPVARSVRFDSRDAADKTPFGAVTAGTDVRFSLTALPGVRHATLVVERRHMTGNQEHLRYTAVARVPMSAASAPGGRQRWTATQRFDAIGIYGWWFEIQVGDRTYVYENNDEPLAWTRETGTGGPGAIAHLPDSPAAIRRYRETVYRRDFTVPAWAEDAVYYYIFPERFRNGDRRNDPKPGVDRVQDHGVEFHRNWNDRPWRPGSGDGSDAFYSNDFFGGDIEGIIQKLDYIKALGANTLYITPMFRAASNHKYDTADYRHIDPHFGTDADFSRLCREAAKRGIRVLPDTSINHVGTDSIYFDRYGHFHQHGNIGAFDGGKIHPESPWASWFTFDPTQKDPDHQYKGWVGVSDLPEVNKAAPSFRKFVYGEPGGIMQRWLDRGAAGWRMDVAPWVPDDFWREWRTAVHGHRPDAFLLAETWFDASKFFLGDEFDAAMDYIFRSAVLDYAGGGDGRAMADQLESLREAYPPQSFHAMMNLLSSHDVPRSLDVLGDHVTGSTPAEVARAKQRFRLALFFQMTYPGAPAIYYGDEVGVTGGADPDNRATYPWKDLGGHPDDALLADVRRLVALRHREPVLRRGDLLAPLVADAHVVVLAHRLNDRWAITATNNGDVARTVRVPLPAGAPHAGWRDPLHGGAMRVQGDALTLVLPPLGGAVVVGGGGGARAVH